MIVTWLVLIAGMWLRLVEDVSQLAVGISWENGDTRWLELGCLNHSVEHRSTGQQHLLTLLVSKKYSLWGLSHYAFGGWVMCYCSLAYPNQYAHSIDMLTFYVSRLCNSALMFT